MASVILVVGFMGMIQAITIGSEMMATARRQTLANQIINHEIEKLRLTSWANLPATGSVTVTIDGRFSDALAACGLLSTDIAVTRATASIDTNGDAAADLKEVTLTLTWTKSGSSTAAATPTGTWLNQLAFYRPSAIARTYTRVSVAYFGKYGVNLNAQR